MTLAPRWEHLLNLICHPDTPENHKLVSTYFASVAHLSEEFFTALEAGEVMLPDGAHRAELYTHFCSDFVF